MACKQSSPLSWKLEELVGEKELFEPIVRNRTVAGGGKREKKGADTSEQAAAALCIQMQVVAGSLLQLITEKHITGHRARVGTPWLLR